MINDFWYPVQFSLIVAILATVITFFLAIWVSYTIISKKLKGENIIESFIMLPLVLPPSVLGFILLNVFGIHSPFGKITMFLFNETILFSKYAAVIAATIVAFPLMYQAAKTGFKNVEGEIEEAAKIDGATNGKVFLYVTLPLASKTLMMGVILSFTRALGEFGATLMFAGNIRGKTETLSTAIYVAIESGETLRAWQYASISISLSLLFLVMIKRLEDRY
ncbi:molybdate ABC transporter permease subunit [Bacillus carboniphilus]|uniref:Molybdenum transport system permease n=1 Tax=Bacillus carboniphilus TaxID=86663 RepID=A0ABY9JXI2_9BACI|nr:molybdate ABC transporter permease subunit [Bacillus carboniphilus]WLR42376.1 molybdate ABC transporter permease subunit [Bacillus carboniphilus]